MKRVIVLLLCLGLVGCATLPKVNSVSLDISKKDLIEAMDEPFRAAAMEGAGENDIAKIKGWSKAERKWKVFTEQEIIKNSHHKAHGYPTVFIEEKSPLVNKFFPNHRIFHEQLVGAQKLGDFILSKDGTIIDVSHTWEVSRYDTDWRLGTII